MRFFYGLLLLLFVSAKAFSSQALVSVNANTCDAFEVKLFANPTTGFQWNLQDYDRSQFNFIKDNYVPLSTTRVGSPGQHVFYFKHKEGMACPESTRLCFRFARAWESDKSACTEVVVHFSAEKNASVPGL